MSQLSLLHDTSNRKRLPAGLELTPLVIPERRGAVFSSDGFLKDFLRDHSS